MDDYRSRLMRGLTVAAVLAVLAGGFLVARPRYARGRLLRAQNAELDRRIAEKDREIAELKENQRRFRTDADFVEQIARQNHRVFPGEIVFVFENDARKPAGGGRPR